MQLNWKVVTGVAAAFVLGVACSIMCRMTDSGTIETYSAKISQESERIIAKEDCIIKNVAVKDKEHVSLGQFVLELNVGTGKICVDSDKLSGREQEAVTEYQDAAIMYKEGIITQEEYDKSLDDYKNTSAEISQEAACNNKTEKLSASKDGVIDLAGNKIGSKIKKDEVIAVINPAERRIVAHFSQKFSKKIKEGMQAEVTIIKYPEKQFTGTVETVDKIDLNGIPVIIKINENVSDLSINDDDNVIVRIVN